MKYILLIVSIFTISFASAHPPKQEYYEIRVYNLNSEAQETRLDAYLKDALVPALHKAGISSVGVFKQRGNDTAAVRKVFLLIPYKALTDLETIESKLEKDNAYTTAGAAYINAAYNDPNYTRYSRILLKAFNGHPMLTKPNLTAPKSDRVYELRSYEGATEKLYKKKVDMFIKGNELALFDKLKFNPIFYAEVLAGAAMPNLMYMTSFENQEERDAHWKAFGEDPDWKKLLGDHQYDNTVSHSDITYLVATDYSDL